MKYYVEETESYYTPREVIIRTQITNAIGCMTFWCLEHPYALKYIKQQCKDPYKYKHKNEFKQLMNIVPTFKQEDAAYVLTYFLSVIFEGQGHYYLKFVKRYLHEIYLELSRSDMDQTFYVVNALPKNMAKLSEFENRRWTAFIIFINIFDQDDETTLVWPTEQMIEYTLEWQFEQVTEHIDVNLTGSNKVPSTKYGIKFKEKQSPENAIADTPDHLRTEMVATKMFLKHIQHPSINFDLETIQQLDAFNEHFDKSWYFYELPFDERYELLKRQWLYAMPLINELNQLRTYYHQHKEATSNERINQLTEENRKLSEELKRFNKETFRLQKEIDRKEKQIDALQSAIAPLERMKQTIAEQDQWIEQLTQQLTQQNEKIQALEKQLQKNDAPDINIDEVIAALSQKSIAIVGGHPNWQAKLIELLPATIIDIDVDFDIKRLNHLDLIIFNTQMANHRIYAKIKNNIKSTTKIIYINESTNVYRTLVEIASQLK